MRVVVALVFGVVLGCGSQDKSTTTSASSNPEDTASAVDTAVTSPADDTADDPCAGQAEVTWSGWAQGFFRGYCTSCHSRTAPDRWGAPEGIDFDTESDVVSRSAQIRSAVLERESMPVGGGVIADDLELLELYLDCGL